MQMVISFYQLSESMSLATLGTYVEKDLNNEIWFLSVIYICIMTN